MSKARQERGTHDQPLPVGRGYDGAETAGAGANVGQDPTITGMFQVRSAAFGMRKMEQRHADESFRMRMGKESDVNFTAFSRA